jgi:hypothetical protein
VRSLRENREGNLLLPFRRWLDATFAHDLARGAKASASQVRGQRVTTAKIRLRITQAPVCPAIAELALFAEPK